MRHGNSHFESYGHKSRRMRPVEIFYFLLTTRLIFITLYEKVTLYYKVTLNEGKEKAMKREPRGDDKKEYLDDLKTIKDLLIEVEEKPLVESWAFFTWGLFIVLGSVLHYITEVYFSFSALDLLLKVWLPVILVGGFFESIAYVKRMTKESIPLFSRTMQKFFLTFAALLLGFGVIAGMLIELHAPSYIPFLITVFMGISFSMYAYVSATWMYFPAFFLILVGILLLIFNFHTSYSSLVIGGANAVAFVWGGILSRRREKK
jgi:hypothetical protein